MSLPFSKFWILFLSFSCLFTNKSQAQTPQASSSMERRVIPPSPSATQLGVFGNLSPDMNSGAIQISIPITQITSRSLSTPIALNYYSTGLLADEVPSWVGLGWTLAAGGVITRTVRGLPDEEPTYGYRDAWNYSNPIHSKTQTNIRPAQFSSMATMLANLASGTYDTEPDSYNFNFTGHSGNILFDEAGNCQISPYAQLAIAQGPVGWRIVDEQGTQYSFEDIETTNSEDHPGLTTMAWYLTEIVSADLTDTIHFTYRNNQSEYKQNLNRVSKIKYSALGNSNCVSDPPFSNGEFGGTPSSQHTIYLSSIVTATTLITFKSDSIRDDIGYNDLTARKLTEITITERTGGQIVRSFSLDYIYLNSYAQAKQQRLCLNSVQEVGKAGHKFTYDQTQDMPVRDGFAKDHWGYYNGQSSNNILIPSLNTTMQAAYSNASGSGANRSAQGAFAQAGILQSITYPTGGIMTVEYEPNIISTDQYPKWDIISNGITSASVSADGGMAVNNSYESNIFRNIYINEMGSDSGLPVPKVSVTLLHLPSGATVTAVEQYNSVPAGPIHVNDGYYNTRLYEIHVDSTTGEITPINRLCNYSGTGNGPKDCVLKYAGQQLPPGNYAMVAAAYASSRLSILASLSMNFIPNSNSSTRELFTREVGGVRVKRIVNYAGQGDTLAKSYYYTEFDSTRNQTISSGQLFSEPDYGQTTPCGNLVVASYDAGKFNWLTSGYHIGYRRVTVQTSSKQGGSTVHHFANDVVPTFRNLPTHIQVFTQDNRLVEQTTYTYTYITRPAATGLKVYQYRQYPNSTQGQLEYGIDHYSHNAYQKRLSVTQEVSFPSSSTATSVLRNKTTYQYRPYGVGVIEDPIRVSRQVGPDEFSISKTVYAGDYYIPGTATGPTIGIKELVDHNMLSVPVEKQTWVKQGNDSSVIAAELNYYTGLRPEKKFILYVSSSIPSNQFLSSYTANGTFVHDNKYQQRIQFSYDAWGNTTEQKEIFGSPTSYIWGHHATQAIAEVRNASADQVAHTSFEPGSPGNWSYGGANGQPDTHLVTAAAVTGQRGYRLDEGWGVNRGNLPPGNYELSFWAKNGSANIALFINDVLVSGPTWEQGVTNVQGFQLLHTRIQVPRRSANDPKGSINLNAYGRKVDIDDIRLYPFGGQMTTFSYAPLIGLKSRSDLNNQPTHYEYDAFGQLKLIRDWDGNIIQHHSYHYKP